MIFYKALCFLALSATLLNPVAAKNDGNSNSNSTAADALATNTNSTAGSTAASVDTNTSGASTTANGGESLTLEADAIQTGSQSNGLQTAEAGQSASDTDNANFINFCAGKELTNGKQVAAGSCNGIPMGDLPSSTNMISTIITNPGPGDTIPANQSFNVTLQVNNIVAGSFTNPNTTYYAAPQTLQGGLIVGHAHVTIQSLGDSIAATTPPDAGTFAFFKGIDDAGNGSGGLSAAVADGLPPGAYRVCSLVSASNHQPVTMPLAQRGAQDDCNKFTVSAAGGETSNSTGSAASASSSSSGGGGGNQNGGGKGGNRRRFVLREFIA